MFAMQGNYWIWILLAFFLLCGNDGCGSGFDLCNIFDGGTNTTLIVVLVAIFLLHNQGMVC